MKKIFLLCMTIVFLLPALALVHSMPREEMYVGGVGAGCTLGYAKLIYGEPMDRDYFCGDGVRVIKYIFTPEFIVTGRTWAGDTRDEEELEIVSFSLRDSSLSTPSGFTVGSSYEKLIEYFGYGEEMKIGGRRCYIYQAAGSPVEMSFYVDDNDIITEIYEGTEL